MCCGFVDLVEHPRHIAMEVEDAMGAQSVVRFLPMLFREINLRDIDRPGRGSHVDEPRELGCDVETDSFLSFDRRSPNMRREDHIVKTLKRGDERLAGLGGFIREDIDCSAGDVFGFDRGFERHLAVFDDDDLHTGTLEFVRNNVRDVRLIIGEQDQRL